MTTRKDPEKVHTMQYVVSEDGEKTDGKELTVC